MDKHTCIKDDGGTPNRRCAACVKEAELEGLKARVQYTRDFESVSHELWKMKNQPQPMPKWLDSLLQAEYNRGFRDGLNKAQDYDY